MNIVITGPKGAGKSCVGEALSKLIGLRAIETDRVIEEIDARESDTKRSYREIFRESGEDVFRDLERKAVAEVTGLDWHIIITGGGTFLDGESRRLLRRNGMILYLIADTGTMWERATRDGVPPMYDRPDGQWAYDEDLTFRDEIMSPFADCTLDTSTGKPETLAAEAAEAIARELAVRARSANTYGDIVRVTTFGESHGKAIGAVLDGIQPGFEISEAVIQKQMDRRRPGQSKVVSQRNEPDRVEILSGVFEGKTTGAPIALIVYNKDQDPSKYEEIKDLFRPGHADYTFYRKYGLRDHRGGGRSSARETATRVASGAIAREILASRGVEFYAHAVEIAGIEAKTCDYSVIEDNPVRCADPEAAKEMEKAILAARKDQDSVGGIVQLDILGVPAGLGDPVFAKLDARLTTALMTVGAVKGVEIGGGFSLSRMKGSESNDTMKDGSFLSNAGGGITGGISTGQTIWLRVALKPTASIAKSQQTIDLHGENRDISVGGRHDPCIVPRAVPVFENMAALTLLDAWEIQSRLRPGWNEESTPE